VRRNLRVDGAVIQASLRAVDPAALMPLHRFRLQGQRLYRIHPEPLLEILTGLLAWCRDGVVQLAGPPVGSRNWAQLRDAADRVLFGSPSFTGPLLDGSQASLCLLHLCQALGAVSAEVRRRRDASTILDVRAALEDPTARQRLLQPYLSTLYQKWQWQTTGDRAELADRILERLIVFLEVAPQTPRALAAWITSSPVRRLLPDRQHTPEWDAALGRFFLADLSQLRTEYLPRIRLEHTWAVWHVVNAEHARLRRAHRRDRRVGPLPDLEVYRPDETDATHELQDSHVLGGEQAARIEAYLAQIERTERLGPRKAAALRWLLSPGEKVTQVEAARRAGLDRKTVRTALRQLRRDLQ
jgi:hypothetical protein